MKKLLLLCTMLLSGIGAWAAGEDYTDINSNLMYTIRNVHGFKNNGSGYKYFMMSNSNETALTGATETDFNNADNKLRCYWVFEPAVESNANAFYIKNVKTNEYLYIDEEPRLELGVKLGDTKTVFYLFNGSEGSHNDYGQAVYIGLQDDAQDKKQNFGIHGNSKMSLWEGAGSGNQWYIESTGFATESYINEAKSIIRSGLGYPKADSDAYQALNALTLGISTMDDVITARDNYYNTTEVEMPQDGKAYTVSAWWKTDGIWPMGWSAANSGTGTTNGKAVYKPLKDNANPSAFVCKCIDGKYVFISDNGYFLSWENEPATGQTSKEYKDAHKFTLEKAVKTGSNIEGELTDLDMFGKFSLKANNGHYLMFSSADRDYHNANAGNKYYGHTNANTVFFVLEEVADYKTNTVKLSAQFEGETCISTFYAPYATVLPDGYTAHKATKVNAGTVHLEEMGSEIPANTGVFVTGPAKEKVVLSLSTSNPTSPNDNLLDGSAVDTYVRGSAYVLANGANGVGLYKATLNKDEYGNSGESHFKNNAGKAYLPASEVTSNSRFFLFDFGGNETGIEEIETGDVETVKNAVYDLSGRRVQKAERGLFIVNGKKVVF